jgi:hypothetical protein
MNDLLGARQAFLEATSSGNRLAQPLTAIGAQIAKHQSRAGTGIGV